MVVIFYMNWSINIIFAQFVTYNQHFIYSLNILEVIFLDESQIQFLKYVQINIFTNSYVFHFYFYVIRSSHFHMLTHKFTYLHTNSHIYSTYTDLHTNSNVYIQFYKSATSHIHIQYPATSYIHIQYHMYFF